MTASRSDARAGRAAQLQDLLQSLLGGPLPLRLRAWDGSEAGPPGAPVLEVRDRRALRHLLWQQDELGLARAWVSGDVDLPPGGDLYAVMEALLPLVESARGRARPRLREHLGTLVRLGALGPRPPVPPEEARELTGRRHSPDRDRQVISHHYDVGNEFYRLVLGPSQVYSCAYWPPGTPDLEAAQAAKLDLVCRKLGLRPGMRLLDVGCGWGSMLLHAARHYGVHGVGITLSREQAAAARERIAQEGLTDRLEVRIQDYREVSDGPFDAISSIGMAEHVGAEPYLAYAGKLYDLLVPEGRLLNHQIARRPTRPGERYELSPFMAAYVFPDGELMPVGGTVSLLERAGFEVRDMEALREHYALTLRAWVANLEAEWERAVKLAGRGRARVWRLYMAACAVAFERNSIGVNQVLAVRTRDSGAAGMPRSREAWQAGSDGPSADGASADGPSV